MALNAEALECRAVAVQLQQEARLVLSKAVEIEKSASDEIAQQVLELKARQQEIERNRAIELEKRIQSEEERQRLKVNKRRYLSYKIQNLMFSGTSTTAAATRTFINNVKNPGT